MTRLPKSDDYIGLPDDYRVIVDKIVPRVVDKFCSKAGDYGDAYKLLGVKGQFSDINRKFWKLYNSIWLGRELLGEQPDECAEDIIGHCLLLLALLERESTPERASFSSPTTPVPPTLPARESGSLGERPGRCPATVERGKETVRCELYNGHTSPHLTNVATTKQYQWSEE